MPDEELKITPQHEDKTPTVNFPILEGEDEEVIFIAQYNPDQMARVIEAVYSRPYHIGSLGAYIPLDFDPEDNPGEINESYLAEVCKAVGVNPTPENIQKLSDLFSGRLAQGNNEFAEANTDKSEMAKYLELVKGVEDHQKLQGMISAYIKANLHERIYEFYGFFVLEVMNHCLAELAKQYGRKDLDKTQKEDIDLIKELTTELIKVRFKARKRGGHEKGIDPEMLKSHYSRLLPIWQQAHKKHRSLRKQGQSEEEVYKTIETTFPDLMPDLIKGFDDPYSYNRAASYIAIEQAARLCGLQAERSDRKYRKYSRNYLISLVSGNTSKLAKRRSRR